MKVRLVLLALMLLPWSRGQAQEAQMDVRKKRLPWIWETPRQQKLPSLKNRDWPTTELDCFVLAKLEEKGLAPAPPADDRTWLRRVHFGITGLPPTADSIREFLADDPAQRRERMIDRV